MEGNKSETVEWYDSGLDLSLSNHELSLKASKKVGHLGDVQEFEHKSNKNLILSKEIIIKDPNKLTEDSLHALKQRLHLRHQNLLKIYGYHLNSSKAEGATLSVFFESFSSDAATEFEILRKEKKHLQEEELYNSLMDVLQALGFLQKHDISHGNLTPESIFMSQKGEIKLLDDSLFENEFSVFQDCLDGAQIPYMSPELFAALKKGKNSNIRINKFKSDAFSVGMVFLYGALLEEPTDGYNWETFTFYPSKLYDRCEQLRRKYPGQFGNILSHLLRLDPDERPDPQQLLANLEYYQKYHWYFRDPKYNSTQSYDTVKTLVAQVLSENYRPKSQTSPYKSDTYSPYSSNRVIHSTVPNTSSYKTINFIDPKVQEIIRETQGSKAPRYEDDYSSYHGQSQRVSHKTPVLRYNNPFSDDLDSHFKEYFSQGHHLAHSSPARDYLRNHEEPKHNFNSPYVNQVISEIRDFYSRHPEYLQNPETNTLSPERASRITDVGGEKLANIEKPQTQSGLLRYETPQKGNQKREWDEYYSLDNHSNKALSNLNPLSSDKKVQTKEDIIKELKERYRNYGAYQEKKEIERPHIGQQENKADELKAGESKKAD